MSLQTDSKPSIFLTWVWSRYLQKPLLVLNSFWVLSEISEMYYFRKKIALKFRTSFRPFTFVPEEVRIAPSPAPNVSLLLNTLQSLCATTLCCLAALQSLFPYLQSALQRATFLLVFNPRCLRFATETQPYFLPLGTDQNYIFFGFFQEELCLDDSY